MHETDETKTPAPQKRKGSGRFLARSEYDGVNFEGLNLELCGAK
jgi:hypothetical protein